MQVRSFTFGSPRVGNRAFYDLFEHQTEGSWRFTHGRDVVPSLPPTCESEAPRRKPVPVQEQAIPGLHI